MDEARYRLHFIFCLLVACGALIGCRLLPERIPPTATLAPPTATIPLPTLPTPTAANTATPPPSPTAASQSAPGEAQVVAIPAEAYVWPTPLAAVSPFERPQAGEAEREVAEELARVDPPERDDVALALAYLGAEEPHGGLPTVAPTREVVTREVGEQELFFVGNVNNNTVKQVNAELLAVGRHAYFWFESGVETFRPEVEDVEAVAAEFDIIYETVAGYFGDPEGAGIDGDPRVHILHALPTTLCNVTPESVGSCGLAGYFTPRNLLPQAINPTSNEREMFVMNVYQFGGNFYLNVLGHELRHMIEANYDHGDADWAVEGSAMLAEDLLGYSVAAWERANLFLANPDQQLNSWTDGNTIPHYGQGYLFNRYLFDRLGVALYREFATHPAPGLLALDQLAADHDLELDGLSLWLDWLVAQAIHRLPGAPVEYSFAGIPFRQVAEETVDVLPVTFDTTVSQYAADYYTLPAGETLTLEFSGSPVVPLLDRLPASGNGMWYAQRANYSNPRLTRALDLRGVESATLEYEVYADIEQGYDFAYVAASADGGATWRPLVGEQMQGLAAVDDPANAAYADRFYTGRTRQWLKERIDLCDFAGEEILLRFEYVTDPILTYGGFAVDNIAVPEIGFYDDGETAVAGWTAEGFTRATAYLPQQWYLLLVTFEGDVPVVEGLEPAADGTLSYTLEASASSLRPILIVAAASPMTLEVAHYRLVLE